jgi:hypothetical protein
MDGGWLAVREKEKLEIVLSRKRLQKVGSIARKTAYLRFDQGARIESDAKLH